jgi:hypothetical protein
MVEHQARRPEPALHGPVHALIACQLFILHALRIGMGCRIVDPICGGFVGRGSGVWTDRG